MSFNVVTVCEIKLDEKTAKFYDAYGRRLNYVDLIGHVTYTNRRPRVDVIKVRKHEI